MINPLNYIDRNHWKVKFEHFEAKRTTTHQSLLSRVDKTKNIGKSVFEFKSNDQTREEIDTEFELKKCNFAMRQQF